MLIQNPVDAGLAPLGKLRNMLIKSAITEMLFSGHSLLMWQGTGEFFVSTPMFYGSLNLIRLCPTRFGNLHMHYMLIRWQFTGVLAYAFVTRHL